MLKNKPQKSTHIPVKDPVLYSGLLIRLRRIAGLPSSPEGYAGQVISNKNPHFWMDTKYVPLDRLF
jgi:hypothetical protein